MRYIWALAGFLFAAGLISLGGAVYTSRAHGGVLDDGRIRGEVTRAVDGDTIALSVRGMERRVRLWGVAAPEAREVGGVDATLALAKLSRGKTALCELVDRSYGREVARCSVDGVDLSAAMIRSGLACWDWTYDRDGVYRDAAGDAAAAGLRPPGCGRGKALREAMQAGG